MGHVVFFPAPDVEPREQMPEDYLRIQPRPEAFGAQVGRGLQQFGEGATRAGQFYGQVAADDATNKWQEDTNKLLYGDPNVQGDRGYYGLSGEDAMHAMPEIRVKVNALRDQYRQGLFTLASQLEFDQNTRRFQYFLNGEIGRHYDQQFSAYQNATNKARADNALHGISGHANDPEAFNNFTGDLMRAYIRDAQAKYGASASEDIINDAMARARSDATTQRVRALVRSDPGAALQVFKDNKDALLGPAQDVLGRELEGVGDEATAGQALQRARGAGGGGMPGGGGENNPGNIRVPGSTGTSPSAFQSYPTPEAGVQAIRDNLLSYQDQHGVNTVQGVISRWSPPNENPTDRLVSAASARTGFAPGQLIDLHDPATMDRMVNAIVAQEGKGTSVRLAANLPSGSPAPGIADVAEAQSNLAMNHARTLANLNADPALADNPRALQRALQREDLDYRSHELALTGQLHALTELRNATADKYVQRMMAPGPLDPTILDEVRADKNLDQPSRENLWRLYEAHTKGSAEGDTAKYGPKFWEYYNRIHAKDGDPQAIRDPSEVYALGGTPDLTLAGVKELTNEIAARKRDPESAGIADVRKGAIAYIKHQLSFEEDYGVIKIRDPKGEDRFNIGALPAFVKYWNDGIAANRSPQELVNKADLDKLIQPFMRSDADLTRDRIEANAEPSQPTPARGAKFDLNTKEGLIGAVQANPPQISRAEAEAIALKNGWIRPSGPQVPIAGAATAPIPPAPVPAGP